MKSKSIVLLLVCAMALHAPSTRAADAYPSHPVKMLVPFPAGSATDQLARIMSQALQESTGQPFVIENVPGAQGIIAAERVAKSAPDGYTLLFSSNTAVASNVALFKKLPYDPTKDFAPIARIGTNALVLMVNPKVPAKSVSELVAYAKANPGKLSAGYGSSSSQICIAMLASMGRLDVVSVPYKGIPQAVSDTVAGTLAFTFVDFGNAMAQSKGGTLRALGVTSEKRSPLLADWPAIAETLPGFDISAWFAIVAPAGTPNDIVDKLADQSMKALDKPEVKKQLTGIAITPAPLRPAETGAFIKAEVVKWVKLARQAGIEPE
jgi:tripartite-type tricarboxylate transporter receptor subunit TctC